MRTVICQLWLESERGWGARPDGFSLHSSHNKCLLFIKSYWAGMPAIAPDEYSRPSGQPFEIVVDEQDFAKIDATDGVRFFNRPELKPGDVFKI